MVVRSGKNEDGFFGFKGLIREHKGNGKKILLLAGNDLKKIYKGAVLGPFWAIIKPIFTLSILWFAFYIGLRASGDIVHNGVSYGRFAFMLTGYVPWFFISEGIIKGARSIRTNKQYVTKISFPVSNIMTFTMLSMLYVHLILLILMVVVLFIMGIKSTLYAVQIIWYLPLMFAFFLALSWTTATFVAFSKDFENIINSIMTGLFWLSGVMWDTAGLKSETLRNIMYFNPINYFANGYRRCFLYNESVFADPKELIIFLAEFVFVVLLGGFNYRRLRKILPDVL